MQENQGIQIFLNIIRGLDNVFLSLYDFEFMNVFLENGKKVYIKNGLQNVEEEIKVVRKKNNHVYIYEETWFHNRFDLGEVPFGSVLFQFDSQGINFQPILKITLEKRVLRHKINEYIDFLESLMIVYNKIVSEIMSQMKNQRSQQSQTQMHQQSTQPQARQQKQPASHFNPFASQPQASQHKKKEHPPLFRKEHSKNTPQKTTKQPKKVPVQTTHNQNEEEDELDSLLKMAQQGLMRPPSNRVDD